jgi:benzoyl-CoA reductase/2-hydroxyglutaryl-CoA dehydratase subunit BcrC/BadD/HgdB
MSRVGITTTVPIEVLLAAGSRPVDLNNIFVTDPDPEHLIDIAERAGFPQNCCAWIKGIYGVALEHGIDTVLCVTTGDCSNTLMLMEVFRLRGLEVIPFAFPPSPDPRLVERELESLARWLGTDLGSAEKVRRDLSPARRLAWELDRLTWREGLISGWENHYWLVSSSDFNGDHEAYRKQLEQVVSQARGREPYPQNMLRLAYIGVPSVFARDLYPYLERQGGRVVFNEIQRQFAMPHPGGSLGEQYANYTYPYSVFDRLRDIIPELRRRGVEGVIHYVQAFCHRGIADIILRHQIELPILTLEGNADFTLTHHLRTRIEAFLDMLRRSQRLLSRVDQA